MIHNKLIGNLRKETFVNIGLVVGVPVFCVYFIIFCIQDILNGNVANEFGANVLGIIFFVIFGGWVCSFICNELKRFNQFIFYDKEIQSINFLSHTKSYDVEDIRKCSFCPNYGIRKKLYSDAIVISLRNKKEIIVFREYHTNYWELKDWLLDHNIEIGYERESIFEDGELEEELRKRNFSEKQIENLTIEKDFLYEEFIHHKTNNVTRHPKGKTKNRQAIEISRKRNYIMTVFGGMIPILILMVARFFWDFSNVIEGIVIITIIMFGSVVLILLLSSCMTKKFILKGETLMIQSIFGKKEYALTCISNVDYNQNKRLQNNTLGSQLEFTVNGKEYILGSNQYDYLDNFAYELTCKVANYSN